jgi:hypothetical protein
MSTFPDYDDFFLSGKRRFDELLSQKYCLKHHAGAAGQTALHFLRSERGHTNLSSKSYRRALDEFEYGQKYAVQNVSL